jgi:hypothetical protein
MAFRSRVGTSLAALVFLGALPVVLQAQSAGNGFFFGRSGWQLLLHGGFAGARADSRIFEFTTEQLTLDRNDFNAFSGGIEISRSVGSRLAISVGVGRSRSERLSEFRDWVDQDDQPILQTTSLSRTPVTLGVRVYVIPPGESVGNLAWVPRRVAPYLTGGVGIVGYTFSQQGDWVDFQDYSVFTDHFESSGSGPLSYLGAGIDFSLTTRFGLTTEIRRQWARAELTESFIGFDKIDLSGTSLSAGMYIRF